MAERENFFLLLELDPSVDDWATIEQRILEKRRAWSRDRSQGNPKARRRADRNLALLEDIETVLKDPETRKQEAKQARKEQERLRQEQLRELDESIGLIRSSGGTCDEEQLKKLIKRFGASVAAGDIKKRLRAAGVRLESAGREKKRPVKAQIDKVTASNVRRNLDHLGLASLYEFLELQPQSSPKALSDRAEEIYKENQRLGKTDADASARNELAGLCKNLFQSEAEKEKYDNTLALEAMEGLKEKIELTGSDRFITQQEMDALVKLARQRGVPAEDARAYIEDYAVKRKWGIQPDVELAAEELKVCGFCSTLAPAGATQCARCGEALEISCPRCGARCPTQNAACESCGCRIGDAPLVHGLLKEGQRRAVEGAFSKALQCFDKALLYWPEWQPAMAEKQKVRSRQESQDTEITIIEQLVSERRLVTAQGAVERFERTHGAPLPESLKRRVREGLAKADATFREGERRRRAGEGRTTLDHLDETLIQCVDFEPARRVLAATPPPPPTGLEVRPQGEGFRLRWQPATRGRNVSYRVLRKAGGGPQSPEDGTTVGEVRTATLDEAAVPVGEAWYYAVFTLRSSVPSHGSAHSGPHLRTAEVAELEVVAGNREVTLRWTTPPGCRRVRVWRKVGAAPKAPGDGTELPVSGDSVHDAGLRNGERYGYRIVAHFADPSDPHRELATAGEAVTATPVAPPAAVEDLNVSRQGKTILLRWTPVAGATVRIRQTAQPPEVSPGLVVAASQADRFGTLVPSVSDRSAQVTMPGQGKIYFVPLSVAPPIAVVGRAAEITNLDPVTELKARRAGTGMVLTWTWPEGLDEVLVCYAHDRYPESPEDGHGSRMRVTRREYERAGCWTLRSAKRERHYFTVFAKATGADLYAAGARIVESMGQTISVSYEVVVRKALLRRTVEDAWVELECRNGEAVDLPALVVVGKARNVPISPRDGVLLAEVPGVRFEQGRATIPIPQQHWRDRSYVKMFFKDAARAREVRLLPAEKEKLRLG